MRWIKLDNKEKILRIITYLVLNRIEVMILIQGSVFTSTFIKMSGEDISSTIGGRPELVFERLVPEEGNALIQTVPEVYIEFSIKENSLRCRVSYIGISSTYPYFGFIVGLPESIEIKERRREQRFVSERPELLSVRFKLGKGARQDKVYNLEVKDCSRYGLGLLVTRENFDLLRMINEGDTLYDMVVFAESALIKINGTVRHTAKIEERKHKGCYMIGIESPDIIEGCEPMSPRAPSTPCVCR